MQKERKIAEDFYEELEESLEYSDSGGEHYITFDKYTGVINVDKYSEDGLTIVNTRRFRLQPVKP